MEDRERFSDTKLLTISLRGLLFFNMINTAAYYHDTQLLTLKRDENPDDIVPHEDGKVQKLRQIGLMCFENVHLQVL